MKQFFLGAIIFIIADLVAQYGFGAPSWGAACYASIMSSLALIEFRNNYF